MTSESEINKKLFDLNIKKIRKQKVIPYFAAEYIDFSDVFGCTFNTKTLEKLLERGMDINQKDENGNTIFHVKRCYLAYFHDSKVMKFAIDNGFDVNSKNEDGDTIFHTRYHHGIINYAISKGLDLFAKNNDGETILHSQYRYIYELDKLEQPNILDNNGNTILFNLLHNVNNDNVDSMENDNDITTIFNLTIALNKMLELGVDPKIENKEEYTFFHTWLDEWEGNMDNLEISKFLDILEDYGMDEESINELIEFANDIEPMYGKKIHYTRTGYKED